MKFFIILMMLSAMLFSAQKQIILGSYSVKGNGERALKTFEDQVDNDIQLQGFIKDNSLRMINTEISGYTVVSLNAFNSYRELLNTMKVLKVYYADAYVLKYPTKNIRLSESFEDVVEKAKMEEEVAVLEAEAKIKEDEDEEKRIELKKLLEMDAATEKETEQVQVEDKSEALEGGLSDEESTQEEALQDVETQLEEVQEVLDETSQKEEESSMKEYMIYIIALALLALIAAGITVMKIASSKSSKQEENV